MDERLAEAFSLACDLTEPLLKSGNHEVLGKLRRLKSLLSVSIMGAGSGKESRSANSQDGAVEDYHQEVVEFLIELAFELMTVDAETGDCELEEISLRAETAVERINHYFEVKTRAKLQDIVAGRI
jgi:hypothetical protein